MCLRLQLGAAAGRHPVLPYHLLIDWGRSSCRVGGRGREERERGGMVDVANIHQPSPLQPSQYDTQSPLGEGRVHY